MELRVAQALLRERVQRGHIDAAPKVLGAPKPISLSRIATTLASPSGGRSGLIGGNLAARSSSGTLPGYLYCVSGIGN